MTWNLLASLHLATVHFCDLSPEIFNRSLHLLSELMMFLSFTMTKATLASLYIMLKVVFLKHVDTFCKSFFSSITLTS